MAIYIALLRGINVGGKNSIKMAELKQHLAAMGLRKVQTYIQSGNVLFESEKEENILRDEIEKEIYSKFGFHVPVVLRTLLQMQQMIDDCPYSQEAIEARQKEKDVEVFYLILFQNPPSQEDIKRLSDAKAQDEFFEIIGRDMYLFLNDSIRFSKLAAILQKTQSVNTARNLRTLNKLSFLANAINTQ